MHLHEDKNLDKEIRPLGMSLSGEEGYLYKKIINRIELYKGSNIPITSSDIVREVLFDLDGEYKWNLPVQSFDLSGKSMWNLGMTLSCLADKKMGRSEPDIFLVEGSSYILYRKDFYNKNISKGSIVQFFASDKSRFNSEAAVAKISSVNEDSFDLIVIDSIFGEKKSPKMFISHGFYKCKEFSLPKKIGSRSLYPLEKNDSIPPI